MSRRQLKSFATMVGICVAMPAAAQSPRDSAVGAELRKLRRDQPVQVALLRSRWAGRMERVGGDTLFIAAHDPALPPMAIRFNAIDTLWRQDDRFGRGAWIGATTAGVLGALTMIALIGTTSEGGASSNDDWEAVGAGLLTGAASGLVGALVGGWIGSGFNRWVRVYP